MRTIIFTTSLFLSLLSFSQSVDGFTIISESNVAVKDAEHFALTDGEKLSKMKQTNTFNISFKDSIFIHTPGAYKSKGEKKEMISQVYKITNVLAVKDKVGIDLILITVKSGLSGKLYDYYVEYNGKEIYITQIYEMKGSKETGYKYTGILFEKLEFCTIRSYKQ